jgi:hypothetical protein
MMTLQEGKRVGRTRLTKAMERLYEKRLIRVGPHPLRSGSRARDVVLRNNPVIHLVHSADRKEEEENNNE